MFAARELVVLLICRQLFRPGPGHFCFKRDILEMDVFLEMEVDLAQTALYASLVAG